MSYPWITNANMGFQSVPTLRRLWSNDFRRRYLRDIKLWSIRNNLYRMTWPPSIPTEKDTDAA